MTFLQVINGFSFVLQGAIEELKIFGNPAEAEDDECSFVSVCQLAPLTE